MAHHTDSHAKIKQANAEFMAACARSDAAGMASLYTAKGQLLPAGFDAIEGREAIQKFWQTVIDMGIRSAVLETVELEPHGDIAIEVGLYKLLVAGGAVADRGKYVVIWKNEDGVWKLHRDIWTTSQPPAK
jgi:uncharacterized protein (TIGR02246 family)